MGIKRLSIRNDRLGIRDAIRNREAFTASAMWAMPYVPGHPPCSTGELPAEWRERFLADRPTYVVYSYRTPIGWVRDEEDGTNVLTVAPDVRYSVTTSKHQSAAALGLFPVGVLTFGRVSS